MFLKNVYIIKLQILSILAFAITDYKIYKKMVKTIVLNF